MLPPKNTATLKSPTLFALLLTLLTACGPSYVYEAAHPIASPEGWAYNEVINFEFPVTDTNQLYDLHLLVDHSVDFGFQNTYVNIKTFFPNGEELEEQVSLQLADKFGQWYGDCNSTKCSLDIPIQQNAFFNAPGNYRIEISQFSRNNPLPGIQQLTFALEEKGRK